MPLIGCPVVLTLRKLSLHLYNSNICYRCCRLGLRFITELAEPKRLGLDASQGNDGIQEVCSYVEASEYLQIKSKRYIVADEGEYSPSYHMLL
ncbi:hypothetical protein YC2023_023149 [Brassica napus]